MSRSRYVLSEPKCRHKRHGVVKAGDPSGVYAATNVCNRPDCIADAVEWAEASTRVRATFVPDVPDGVRELWAVEKERVSGVHWEYASCEISELPTEMQP